MKENDIGFDLNCIDKFSVKGKYIKEYMMNCPPTTSIIIAETPAEKVTEKFFKESNTDTEKIFSLSLNDGIVVYYMVEGYNWKLRIAEDAEDYSTTSVADICFALHVWMNLIRNLQQLRNISERIPKHHLPRFLRIMM